jgi:hypothetical protein
MKNRNGETVKHSRIYHAWYQMIKRCYNPKNDNYNRYGGKGITVCKEWIDSFQSFLNWALSNGYSDKLTIDRVESDKPYEPSNCRWSFPTLDEAVTARESFEIELSVLKKVS